MPRVVKEEERIEKIIRGLLKLPENKRCINCSSLGPQYVCTTFWTFVCTNCSGVHREFTHRVKSVSMAKFSAEEVAALQVRGNERARQIYFKAWDPQRNSFPDGSNLHRLRDFIKHIYIDQKYAGVRSNDKLSMVKAGDKEDYLDRHSFEISSRGARDDFFESHTDKARRDDFFERHSFGNSFPRRRTDDRNLRYHIDERNSPRYKEKLKSGSQSRRAARFEIVDDRFREEGFGTVRKFESHRYSNVDSRARSSSPVPHTSRDMESQPAIRPLKDILSNKVPPLKVGDPPKEDVVSGSAHVQTAGSSKGPASVDKIEEENKTVNTLSSLIDFDANPEPSATTAEAHSQQTVPASDGGKIDDLSARNENAFNCPNVNSLESLLFGLADPAGSTYDTLPGGDTPAAIFGSSNTDVGTVTGSQTKAPGVSNDVGITTASYSENAVEFPGSSSDSKAQVIDAQQLPAVQHSQPSAVTAGNQSLTLEPTHVKGPPTNASSEQSPQVVPKAAQDNSLGTESSSGRKELPVDLFTSSYSSFATALPSWQSTSHYGMGYSTQYHATAMSMGDPQDSVKSRNPFDIGDDGPHDQATMFPSMSSLQGTLSTMSPSPGLQSQVSPYTSAMHPQRPYGMMRPPGAYMWQQLPNNMLLSRPQGVNSFGSNDAAFASLNHIQQSSGINNDASSFAHLNPLQQPSGENPLLAAPNAFQLAGGNPFG